MKIIKRGQIFGEGYLLYNPDKRRHTSMTLTNCKFWGINKRNIKSFIDKTIEKENIDFETIKKIKIFENLSN